MAWGGPKRRHYFWKLFNSRNGITFFTRTAVGGGLAGELGRFFNYVNSNIGVTIFSVGATYLLTRGAKEEELSMAREENKANRLEIDELNSRLRTADEKISKLIESKTNTSSQFHRYVEKYHRCLGQKELLKFAYDNSVCFFRMTYNYKNIKNKVLGTIVVNKGEDDSNVKNSYGNSR